MAVQRPRRILLVEDDAALLSAFERAFRNAGETQITAVGTFEEARELLRTEYFDVLITDVRLGASNGLQLAMRARDTFPDIQLIVYSGYPDPVLQDEARRLGARYVAKPITGQQLVGLVQRIPR